MSYKAPFASATDFGIVRIGTGGELLDTTASKTLSTNASISVVFRAGAWRII